MSTDGAEKLSIRLAYARKRSPFGVVAWSPDGTRVAATTGLGLSGDGCIWIWRLGQNQPLVIEGHEGEVRALAWSPDGESLLSGSDDTTVRIWDSASGQQIRILHGHGSDVRTIALAPDGHSLASSSYDGTVRIWDVSTGRQIYVLRHQESLIRSLAWAPNSRSLAAASHDKTVRIWDSSSGQQIRILKGHQDSVGRVAWAPNGNSLASASNDRTVRIWDSSSGQQIHLLKGHGASALDLAWAPNGNLLASSSIDRTLRIWDSSSGEQVHLLQGHQGSVENVTWAPDGNSLASSAEDKTVRIWNFSSGQQVHILQGPQALVPSVSWAPDGSHLASASADETVRIWNFSSGQLVLVLQGHQDSVSNVAWAPDGTLLASTSEDKAIRIWSSGSREQLRILHGHQDSVRDVSWAPDSNFLASASKDKAVRIWTPSTGQQVHLLQGHQDSVSSVVWAPDASALASASDDNTVRIWDRTSGRQIHILRGHQDSVRGVAWAPNTSTLASASDDSTVRTWDSSSGRQTHILRGHQGSVQSVAWAPNGACLASASDDNTVRIWDAVAGQLRTTLEGHRDSVVHVAWSDNGRFLVSATLEGEVIVWDASSGQEMAKREGLPFRFVVAGLTLGAGATREFGAFGVDVWKPEEPGAASPDPRTSEQAAGPERPSVVQTAVTAAILQSSAKVVLAGDSNAGKTCLARRLAEDRYEGGQSSTHGMQIWTLASESLHPDGKAPEGQSREVFLWDLGGQEEYQLVNQLFLNDSTVALVLFDGTRGPVGLESVRKWDQRIEARNETIRKLLIRSKSDETSGVVDDAAIDGLREQLKFDARIDVSALEEQNAGVGRLRQAIHDAIAWDKVALTSRPASFQRTRDHLNELRQSGVCLVDESELIAKLGDSAGLEITLGHLSREGQIVDIRLQTRDRVIVLRVDVLSRYAGSLVQAAKKKERGIPALDQSRILTKDMEFPGLKAEERMPSRTQERTVVEATVRLMIERGICFDHEGLLIFPTLFDDHAAHDGTLPASAPIYYDFNGPIDNIYASLVAKLAVSEKFGPVRLWSRYAEFGGSEGGSFGLRRVDAVGRGHLDLYFDPAADPELQKLFRDYVNDHLMKEGVKVLSGMAFRCECGNEFSERNVRKRLENKQEKIQCQECDRSYSLFQAAGEPVVENTRALVAFKGEVAEKLQRTEAKVAAAMHEEERETPGEPLRILHLSDLHFTGETRRDSVLQPLYADLWDRLKVQRLDYLVVSGDFADKCNAAGFDVAREFLQELSRMFEISPLKTVLVPGNHDYRRDFGHFQMADWKPELRGKGWHQEGNVGFFPNEKYVERFDSFRRFYHTFYSAKEYPLQPEKQYELFSDKDTGLHFLCLNSAWTVDQFRLERASLNNDALSSALLGTKKVPLGIAVWHHAATGDRKIADTRAVQRLADAGFRIVLHGDVHEERDEALQYLDPQRRIHVIGGGSFGAPANDRPESTPRLYSLLEVSRDLRSVTVHRRHQRTAEGPYDEWAIYNRTIGGKTGSYEISLE